MHAGELWNVLRQDDNGNRFVVETRLSRVAAEQRVAEFESHGHKQVYWLEPADPVAVGCEPDAEPRR